MADNENSDWAYLDLLATCLSRDTDRDLSSHAGGQDRIEMSGGHHPGQGQYVIDPDYFELLGFSDPSELIKNHK